MTADGKPVCVPEVARSDGHPDLYVSDADARLIAHAPEMLSAIVRLADDLEDGHWSYTKEYLRDLIERATQP